MGRSTAALTAALALAALLACKKSEPSPEPAPEPAAPAADTPTTATQTDFSGSWKTGWGPVTLTQSGSSVTGSYSGKFTGKLDGTANGNVAELTWTQTNGEHGKARFTLASDGDSFKGTWGANSSYTNGGSWNGTRKQ
jgi:hypothetical protein